jgi:NADPH:quinone reductase-like Zn-dependent oxidoreductase
MRAIHKTSCGSPDVLSLIDLDTPQPTDDQVLVQVEAASLNTADLDRCRRHR